MHEDELISRWLTGSPKNLGLYYVLTLIYLNAAILYYIAGAQGSLSRLCSRQPRRHDSRARSISVISDSLMITSPYTHFSLKLQTDFQDGGADTQP